MKDALGGKNESSPTRKAVAEELQISQAYISYILNGKRKGSLELLINMACIAGVDHLIDEGLKIEIDVEATSTIGLNTTVGYEIIRKNEPQKPPPPSEHVRKMLDMAREVLESDTHWSESLSMNIDSFFKGMIADRGDRRRSVDENKIPPGGDRRKAAG